MSKPGGNNDKRVRLDMGKGCGGRRPLRQPRGTYGIQGSQSVPPTPPAAYASAAMTRERMTKIGGPGYVESSRSLRQKPNSQHHIKTLPHFQVLKP